MRKSKVRKLTAKTGMNTNSLTTKINKSVQRLEERGYELVDLERQDAEVLLRFKEVKESDE